MMMVGESDTYERKKEGVSPVVRFSFKRKKRRRGEREEV